MRALARAALLAALIVPVAPAAAQETIVVTRTDDPAPDGSCTLGGGDCSLREAVALANLVAGEQVVQLPAGAYSLTNGVANDSDVVSGDLDVYDILTIEGAGAAATRIDVVVADRAFDLAGGAGVTIRDLTVSGGGQVPQGGAIRTTGVPVVLERVALRGNTAEFGGGLLARGGAAVTLTDVVVAENNALDAGGGVAAIGELAAPANPGTLTINGGEFVDNVVGGSGGGIFADDVTPVEVSGALVARNTAFLGAGIQVEGPGVTATVRDAQVLDNRAMGGGAGSGGGLFPFLATLVVERALVEGNFAQSSGGAVHIVESEVTLTDTHLSANEAGDGGAISHDGDLPLRLVRSLVSGNVGGTTGGITGRAPTTLETTTVSGNRGGIVGGIRAERLTLVSSTVAANVATADTNGNLRLEGPVTLTGSVVANPGGGTQPDDVNCTFFAPAVASASGSVASDASCALGGGNLDATDPLLQPLALNGGTLGSHALMPASPAIDFAGPACPSPDARGIARPADGNQDGAAACDAGAYEFVPGADLNLTLADSPDPVAVRGILTYTATVFNAGPQAASGTRLALTLAEGLTDIVAAPDAGTCSVAGQAVTCELGALAAPGEARVRVSATTSAQGQVTTAGTATSAAFDPTPADAGAQAATTVGAGGGLDVIAGDGVIPTAIAIAQRRFSDPVLRPPAGVVLSRDDVFADSLGAAVLTPDGPLLFTATAALDPRTAAEIDRLLGGAGTVTLLGGASALSAAVADALTAAGYTIVRLQGPSRVETAIAVARAAAPQGPATVALARADGPPDNPTAAWADAVTGGAWSAASGAPVLLTATAALHPAVAAYLDEAAPTRRVLLGGEAALSPAVAGAAGPHERIQGSNRYATAVAIATVLWLEPAGGYLVTAGDHPDGWAYALAAAGLAADVTRPVLLVETARLPDETAASSCASGPGALTVIGGDTVVSPDVRAALSEPC